MAKFTKGTPKPPGSGIKKGQTHKRKMASLYDALLAHNCDFDSVFAKALMAADDKFLKVLIEVMPWIRPKFKEIEMKGEPDEKDAVMAEIASQSDDELKASLTVIHESASA